MKVLLSIEPEFAAKIFNGSKGYEYRRAILKHTEVRTIVVYASNPIKKVIGEFDIEKIIQDDPMSLWSSTKECSGITLESFLKYFTNKKIGYAIKIASTKIYDSPKPLSSLNITTAPQSFRYLPD